MQKDKAKAVGHGWLKLAGGVIDALVVLCEVLDGIDHSRGRPSSNCVVRVLGLEPGHECAWIAAANQYPLVLSFHQFVLFLNKALDVSQRLRSAQPFEVCGAPASLLVSKWL